MRPGTVKHAPKVALNIPENPSLEGRIMMRARDLKSLSMEELWSLHQLITSFLTRKIVAEKARLDRQLNRLEVNAKLTARRRVFPKYQNPARPSETWAGRGKQPRWLTAQLKS